mmetsp:Transcript_26064/g.54850  ORF Transcript_26064/g.54850 Transcript_26064/m.54850 type:complete len:158 (-) Transcript_26064:56-529(-)
MKKNPNILNGKSIGSWYFVRYEEDQGIKEARKRDVQDTDVLPFEESANRQNRSNNEREHLPKNEGKRGVDDTDIRNQDYSQNSTLDAKHSHSYNASISGTSESRCDIDCGVVQKYKNAKNKERTASTTRAAALTEPLTPVFVEGKRINDLRTKLHDC